MKKATEGKPRLTRRELLGAAAAVSLGSTSGCVERVRSIVSRQSPTTVSLTVTAPPADADRMATLIARHMVENFETVGIDATLDILPEDELYRQVLYNRNFELFVAQLPPMEDPIALDSLVNSVYAGEPGWQNPYSFTDITVDDYLQVQRTVSGDARRTAVSALLERLSRDQPFLTIALPDEIRAVRTDRFTGWQNHELQDPISYLALERGSEISDEEEEVTLTLSMTDGRLSENLNPLAVEYRKPKPFTTLLYDPLVRQVNRERIPWLASGWQWEPESAMDVGSSFLISLRPGLTWHDGRPLTASDLAFTFEFLTDTSLDTLSHAVPAPRFRSISSLVEDVFVIDDTTAEVVVGDASEEVATHLLTVPILPEHIWTEHTDIANIQGIEGSEGVTEALVWTNEEAVGSGPLTVQEVATDEGVTLEPFGEHFLWRREPGPENIPEQFTTAPAFDEMVLQVVPSNETAVELVAEGEIDGTATNVDSRPPILERMVENPGVSKLVEASTSPYQIGYNTGQHPFSNPHFRRMLGQLIDKQHITNSIFEGYGRPVANPFDGTKWSPSELEFNVVDPEVPFLGENGEVDVEAARELFRDQGFEFDEDGRLILR